MSLKNFLMTIFTFGWNYRKMYLEMHKQVHNDTDRVKEVVYKAEKAQKQYLRKAPRVIQGSIYDTTDPEYMRHMYEVAKHPIFIFFLQNVRMDVYEMLNNVTDDKAVEVMGMSKGLKHFIDSLSAVVSRYEAYQNGEEDLEEDYEDEVMI